MFSGLGIWISIIIAIVCFLIIIGVWWYFSHRRVAKEGPTASEAIMKQSSLTHQQSSNKERTGNEIRILYLEDDPALTELLPEVIRNSAQDIRIVGTTSINEALHQIETEDYDAVLLDIMMPPIDDMPEVETEFGRLTGIVVAQRMKSIKPDIPIIAFTHLSDPLIRNKIREAGISSVITKPAEPESIIDSLIRYVQKK